MIHSFITYNKNKSTNISYWFSRPLSYYPPLDPLTKTRQIPHCRKHKRRQPPNRRAQVLILCQMLLSNHPKTPTLVLMGYMSFLRRSCSFLLVVPHPSPPDPAVRTTLAVFHTKICRRWLMKVSEGKFGREKGTIRCALSWMQTRVPLHPRST